MKAAGNSAWHSEGWPVLEIYLAKGLDDKMIGGSQLCGLSKSLRSYVFAIRAEKNVAQVEISKETCSQDMWEGAFRSS